MTYPTKTEIIRRLCYTELVYGRINKKLKLNLSRGEIENLITEILTETDPEEYLRKGKNVYVMNFDKGIRITVNSYTCRVITVDRIV